MLIISFCSAQYVSNIVNAGFSYLLTKLLIFPGAGIVFLLFVLSDTNSLLLGVFAENLTRHCALGFNDDSKQNINDEQEKPLKKRDEKLPESLLNSPTLISPANSSKPTLTESLSEPSNKSTGRL